MAARLLAFTALVASLGDAVGVLRRPVVKASRSLCAISNTATLLPATTKESNRPTVVSKEPKHLGRTPRIIWTFWDKGESNLPSFLSICLQSWRHNCPGWEVIVLSPSNIREFLDLGTDLPSTFLDIERASLQSDVARVAILARYGGIYADISTLAMSNVAEVVRSTLDGGASLYSYHNFGWIHDFVAAWFMGCKPEEPVMLEWNRALNHILEGRINDHDIHQHPYLQGIDLSDYQGDRPVGKNHPSKCWADYLIVNVALRSVLQRNPRLAERFWRSACLINHGQGNHLSPTRLFDHADQVGVNVDRRILSSLAWPDGPLYVSTRLLQTQSSHAMRTAATAPFVKFFQAGKVWSALQDTGLSGLAPSSGIAQLIDIAFETTPSPLSPTKATKAAHKFVQLSTLPGALRRLLLRRVKPGSLFAPPFTTRDRRLHRLKLWLAAVAAH